MDAKRQNFVNALLVGVEGDSRLMMHGVFRAEGWQLYEAVNRQHAMQCLERRPVHMAIVNADCNNWPWKQALRDLQRIPRPPQLVVTSRIADETLWAEVLNWGAYDLLAEPFRRDEVERVVAAARRHFEGRPPGAIGRRAAAAS